MLKSGVTLKLIDTKREKALARRARRAADETRVTLTEATLPYGIWTCRDGRQVLFNRHYDPIWWRYPGQPATAADPNEWVMWIEQDFFFNDGDAPWDGWNGQAHAKARARCSAVLKSWGVDPEPWFKGA